MDWLTAVGTVGAVAVALFLSWADRRRARKSLRLERVIGASAQIAVLGELFPTPDCDYQGQAELKVLNRSAFAIYSVHVHYSHAGLAKEAHIDTPVQPGSEATLTLPDPEPEAVLQTRGVELVFRSSDGTWWRRKVSGDLEELNRDCHPSTA